MVYMVSVYLAADPVDADCFIQASSTIEETTRCKVEEIGHICDVLVEVECRGNGEEWCIGKQLWFIEEGKVVYSAQLQGLHRCIGDRPH